MLLLQICLVRRPAPCRPLLLVVLVLLAPCRAPSCLPCVTRRRSARRRALVRYLLICAPTPKYGVDDVVEFADVGVTPPFTVPWISAAYSPPVAITTPDADG